jgi:hypothetical protein
VGNSWTNEPIKCTMTFDNQEEYVVYMGKDPEYTIDANGAYVPQVDEDFIKAFRINESESETSGNPVGIIMSNTCNLSIFNYNNELMISNASSKFYGYMRNGVELKFEITYDDGLTYKPYGVYYVTDWSTDWNGGANDVTVIMGADKLQYISCMSIPKLPAYSGINIQTLLINLFVAIDKITRNNSTGAEISGVSIPTSDIGNDGDYYINTSEVGIYIKDTGVWQLIYFIDSRLNLSMNFGITVGSQIKEVLNSIAQALLAKIIVDRSGVIRVISSLYTYGNIFVLNDDDLDGKWQVKHNPNNIYNKAVINYKQMGQNQVDTLLEQYGFTLKQGVNQFNGLKFYGKALDVENVYFETAEASNGIDVILTELKYQAYQDGIDVSVTSNIQVENCNLIVEGRLINSIEASEETIIPGADIKVSNPLPLVTDVIQNQEDAKQYANNVSDYLSKTSNIIVLNTLLTPEATIGDTLIANTPAQELIGTYKIINNQCDHGGGYSKILEVFKISDTINWEDGTTWDDGADGGAWVESASNIIG